MSSLRPTVLIVHGGYFLPSAWSEFIISLKAAGFEAQCPRLPSRGDERPPTKTLEDDAKVVRDAAKELTFAGKRIILLAHSYGGIPASEAITPSLYASNPTNQGSGVVYMIFLSAWLIPKSSSLQNLLEQKGFQTHVELEFNEDGTAYAKNAPDSFYNDIQPRAHAEDLAKQNVTHNWAAVGGTVEGVPWIDTPSTYVHCVHDQALLFEMQKDMVNGANEAIGSKTRLVTETLQTGHCPFLSAPDELVRIVARAADSLEKPS
ncbi:MAG: hypothetical protein Q9201_007266 [Fulgogasparrea decipioides]